MQMKKEGFGKMRKTALGLVAAFLAQGSCGRADADVVIENARFRLTVGADAAVRSLKIKATGEECVPPGGKVPLFSVTSGRRRIPTSIMRTATASAS